MKNIYLLLIIIFAIVKTNSLEAADNKNHWTIGILAQRGDQRTFLRWQPWIDDLNRNFPHDKFKLVPLGVDYIEYHQKADLDFILSNQSQIFLEETNPKWLLTLLSPPQGYGKESHTQIGSAILVSKNSPFKDIKDLANQTIAGVSENAFGGFLIGYQKLLAHKLEAKHDFKLKFYGFPVDNVIYALKNKEVQAAIAPSCLLETMVNEGEINYDDFRILNPVENDIGCLSSTELLPNWSLSSLKKISPSFEKKFTDYLLQDHSQTNLPKWTNAYYNNSLIKILHNMRNHKKLSNWQYFQNWVKYNLITFWAIVLLIVIIIINFIYLTLTLKKRTKKLNHSFKQLQEYQRMLTHADRMNTLGEMSAGIAHEIHQPLTAINLYALGLQSSQNSPNSVATLNKIMEQVTRIKNIIQNLRNFSEKRPEKEQKLVNLKPIIDRTVNFIANSNDQNVKIVVKCSPQLTAFIRDSVLEQIICNTLLNSIQANATLIQVIAQDQIDAVFINIIDNGKGFNPEMLKFPFVPFKTTKENGLGLGMVICQRLIQSEFGDISIANNANGIGAIITIKLNKKIR